MENRNNALDIVKRFPEDKYTLLIPIKTVAQIAEIQRPVMNTVYISTDLNDKEIYIHEKAKGAYTDRSGYSHPATPNMYAITKKGLTKLMRAAGIKQIESQSVTPSICQRCAEVNRGSSKMVCCGSCESRRDVKYECTISVPQLTGENQIVIASKEIAYQDAIIGMTDKQIKEFTRFRSEMCESKALNRALRAAMQIKGTYLLEELKKPFVVAYLAPNLDNPQVRDEAVKHMFESKKRLFGSQPAIRIDETTDGRVTINQETGEVLEGHFMEVPNSPEPPAPPQEEVPPCPTAQFQDSGYICGNCDHPISKAVYNYSTREFGAPLCMACQKEARKGA